jgi:aminobenzoyl-glutamate utilization protein B
MSIGHKGMIYASKAMSMTMLDLFENPDMIKDVKAEYVKRKGNIVWEPMIDGPPPINAKGN